MNRLLDVFLSPGNRVSDAAGLSDPGERGAMGILINMLVWMLVAILAFLAAYFVWMR